MWRTNREDITEKFQGFFRSKDAVTIYGAKENEI